MEDNSDSDVNQSDLIDTDTNDGLVSELIVLIPTLPEISQDKFSQSDLRADGKAKIISDHMYALHVAYLFWKKNRRLEEAIPLLIRQSIERVKPELKDDSKLIRSFVQKSCQNSHSR